ncbi:S8 family serine peptidase [candidate division WWE3 bacterium]|uniref:S8 family serine peptidase n=1 Tax=candidate division WWE3 bacterium TaxID=2053526 RepID=A0A955LK96_UNCKA|nr:S8 family serine peptidase [candidate division WWE3 bacterium]
MSVIVFTIWSLFFKSRSSVVDLGLSGTGASVPLTDDRTKVVYDGQETVVVKDMLVVSFDEGVDEARRQELMKEIGGESMEEVMEGFWSIYFPTGTDLQDKFLQMQGVDGYASVDYNVVRSVQAYTPFTPPPNDYTTLGTPWWLEALDMPTVWGVEQGDENVLVGVVDSTIRLSQEDLAGKVDMQLADHGETDGDHGTHVAGIIGAATDNNKGVASIGANIHMIGATGCESDGTCRDDWVAAAIAGLVAQGVKVINLSVGSPTPSNLLENAVNFAWGSGVVVVAAAGNCGMVNPPDCPTANPTIYPAAYDKVIAVGASNQNGDLADFSEHGSWVDVAAPGVGIASTVAHEYDTSGNQGPVADDSYVAWSGTSMASPMVASIAAMILSQDPTLTNTEVRALIEGNTTNIAGVNHGLVSLASVFGAMGVLLTPTDTPTPTPTPSDAVGGAWMKSDPLPAEVEENPAPAFALGDKFYVVKRYGVGGWYAQAGIDGNLTNWQPFTGLGGSEKGYALPVANGDPWLFRTGHYMRYDGNASGDTFTQNDLCSGGACMQGLHTEWDDAITAEFASGKIFFFHLGGYYHGTGPECNTNQDCGYTQMMRSAEVPMGNSANNFTELGNNGWTGGSIDSGNEAQYKAAFVQSSDPHKGFIYMGKVNSSEIRRIVVNDNGQTEGSWETISNPGAWGRGEMIGHNDWLYVIRGTRFYRAKIDTTTGMPTGSWETLPSLPAEPINVSWGGDHPEGSVAGVINNVLYVLGANESGPDRVYYIGIDRNQLGATPPTPPTNCDARLSALSGNWPFTIDMAVMESLGVPATRLPFSWDDDEPAINFYNWAARDIIMADAHSRGIDIVASIVGTPSWAAPGDSRPPHRRLPNVAFESEYKEYLRLIVQKYPYITKFEFWNEENSYGSMVGSGDTYDDASVTEYAYWLKVTYDTLKGENRDIEVSVGGLDGTFNEAQFLVDMHTKPGGHSYDVVSVHPYELNGPADLGWVDQIHSIAGKPIWITEYGWEASAVGEANQAAYLQQTLDTLFTPAYSYVKVAILLAIRDFGSSTWGITNGSGVHRAAYSAFEQAIQDHCSTTTTNTLATTCDVTDWLVEGNDVIRHPVTCEKVWQEVYDVPGPSPVITAGCAWHDCYTLCVTVDCDGHPTAHMSPHFSNPACYCQGFGDLSAEVPQGTSIGVFYRQFTDAGGIDFTFAQTVAPGAPVCVYAASAVPKPPHDVWQDTCQIQASGWMICAGAEDVCVGP